MSPLPSPSKSTSAMTTRATRFSDSVEVGGHFGARRSRRDSHPNQLRACLARS
jgi:hypothetical protein